MANNSNNSSKKRAAAKADSNPNVTPSSKKTGKSTTANATPLSLSARRLARFKEARKRNDDEDEEKKATSEAVINNGTVVAGLTDQQGLPITPTVFWT